MTCINIFFIPCYISSLSLYPQTRCLYHIEHSADLLLASFSNRNATVLASRLSNALYNSDRNGTSSNNSNNSSNSSINIRVKKDSRDNKSNGVRNEGHERDGLLNLIEVCNADF